MALPHQRDRAGSCCCCNFPGGFVQILFNLRDIALGVLARRTPEIPVAGERACLSVEAAALPSRTAVPDGLDVVLRTST